MKKKNVRLAWTHSTPLNFFLEEGRGEAERSTEVNGTKGAKGAKKAKGAKGVKGTTS